jgi:hypothetical protein
MAEEKDMALIEGYLQGGLDKEQEAAVAQRLAEDADFKLLFEDTRLMIEGLGKLRHKGLLHRIDSLEAGLENPLTVKKKVKTISWTVSRMAAAFTGIALLALASWYVFRADSDAGGASLYEEYYTVYTNTIVPKVRSGEDPTLIVRTFKAYDEADFVTAEPLFGELLKVNNSEFVRFYAAIAYMEVGETEKASGLLTTIISEEGGFMTQAKWYLALNYIRTEDYQNAKSLLKELAGSSTTYQDKAQELLKKMR